MTHLRGYWWYCQHCKFMRVARWKWLAYARHWAHWLGHVRVWRRS